MRPKNTTSCSMWPNGCSSRRDSTPLHHSELPHGAWARRSLGEETALGVIASSARRATRQCSVAPCGRDGHKARARGPMLRPPTRRLLRFARNDRRGTPPMSGVSHRAGRRCAGGPQVDRSGRKPGLLLSHNQFYGEILKVAVRSLVFLAVLTAYNPRFHGERICLQAKGLACRSQ